MKKNQINNSQWQIRHQRKLLSKIRKSNQKKNRIKRRKSKKSSCWWDKCIEAPEIFSVFSEEYREEYLDFLGKIQSAVNNDYKKIRINFERTRIIVADAGILLRANLSTLIVKKHKHTILKCAPSKSAKINEVLTQIRILELFGQNFDITPNHEDVVHWNLAEGHGADGEKYEKILGSYDGTLTPKLSESFYLGLTEAMTNTRQHAYSEDELNNPDIPEWWMFSQEKEGRLTVVFFDLGIGIPESLPKKQPGIWEKIISVMKESDGDAEIIEGTIRLKKSSTELGHRGKGLSQLEEVINGVDDAVLYIYSNKGCYSLKNKGEKKLVNYDQSINGTLINWSVPI